MIDGTETIKELRKKAISLLDSGKDYLDSEVEDILYLLHIYYIEEMGSDYERFHGPNNIFRK